MEEIALNVFVGTTCCYVGENVPSDCVQVTPYDFDRLLRGELRWEGNELVPNE